MLKQYCFILLWLCAALCHCMGQGTDSVKQLILHQRLLDAKTLVEQILAQPNQTLNADAWYFKGYTYYLISKDSTVTIPLTNAKVIAFNAFVQCLTINPSHKWLVRDKYRPLLDIYFGLYSAAQHAYSSKQYSDAYDNYVLAETVEQYLHKKDIGFGDLKFPKQDTALLYNIANAAIKANREKESIQYLCKLANMRIADPIYMHLYVQLVDYYMSIHDEIGFRKYLTMARSLFPYNSYWIQAEVDMVKSGNLDDALIKTHEIKIQAAPNSYDVYYNYASDLITLLYFKQQTPKNYKAYTTKLDYALQQCTQLQKQNIQTDLLYAQYYYHEGAMKPLSNDTALALKVKIAALQKALPHCLNIINHYAAKPQYTLTELTLYKKVVGYTINIYEALRMQQDLVQTIALLTKLEATLPIYVPKIKQKL